VRRENVTNETDSVEAQVHQVLLAERFLEERPEKCE
jgi:hypothetical protein